MTTTASGTSPSTRRSRKASCSPGGHGRSSGDEQTGYVVVPLPPTVSDQRTTLASLRIDPEQRSVALYQVARYSQECRVYAPMYRQLTLAGLSGTSSLEDPALVGRAGYGDVLQAWRTYLRRDNHGRGAVMIGHSQGSLVLEKLIAEQIDPKPSVRRRLVSAILLGGNVTVRRGADAGGSFRRIPACRSARQTGCVIAFSTFDGTVPADALFGRTSAPGRRVLCTNPAALGGGSGRLETIFPSAPFAPGTTIAAGISLLGLPLPHPATPWVGIRGAFSARCSAAGGANVLQLSARGAAPTLKPSPDAGWGLHLADANLALGNLVEVVGTQTRAWLRKDR